jgi:hypothetical protein
MEVVISAWMVEAMKFMAEFGIDLYHNVEYALNYKQDEFLNT